VNPFLLEQLTQQHQAEHARRAEAARRGPPAGVALARSRQRRAGISRRLGWLLVDLGLHLALETPPSPSSGQAARSLAPSGGPQRAADGARA